MKKLSILTCTMIALTSFAVITVWAAHPHFLRCSASGVNSDGQMTVCFKIAGLGSINQNSVTVTASASADATYGCLNGGEQCPNAANKVNVQMDVSATGNFPVNRNGQATGCLPLNPPPTTLTCPNGQELVLVSVSYTDVKVTGPGGAECDISGTFYADFFDNCP
jgi:hypothetical protein